MGNGGENTKQLQSTKKFLCLALPGALTATPTMPTYLLLTYPPNHFLKIQITLFLNNTLATAARFKASLGHMVT